MKREEIEEGVLYHDVCGVDAKLCECKDKPFEYIKETDSFIFTCPGCETESPLDKDSMVLEEKAN